MENYEEKYKAALERAKSFKLPEYKNIMTSVFPELKEREDERIKNEIVAFVEQSIHRGGGTPIPQEQENKWLTWLEKQGSADKTCSEIAEKNVNEETNAPTAYGKYVDECLNDAAKHFFSEGEDKYSVADLFYAGVKCGKSWLEKQDEQKSWSEKDEHWRQKAIDFMKHPDLIKATPILAKDTIEWLKSLKDRVQPTIAWNENDEVALESAATKYAQDKYLPVQTAQAFKAGAEWMRERIKTTLNR